MIEKYSILALIPARGGSKGIPRKNVTDLGGRPLIVHTIVQALKSKYIDRLVLSSDDEEIMEVARSAGCEVPFRRPTDIASDEASALEVILHAIKELDKFDYIVLLQPTSPFRTVEDIDACIEKCISTKMKSCVSVTKVEKSPFWMYTLDNGEKMSPILGGSSYSRRQDTPDVYELNGAVYVLNCVNLKEGNPIVGTDTIAHVMPAERSVDIDTMIDLKLAEAMYVSLGNN